MNTTLESAIPLDPSAREELIGDLIARADVELSKAAHIYEVNEAYPGEAHNIGGALLSLGTARFALGIAEALFSLPPSGRKPTRQVLAAT